MNNFSVEQFTMFCGIFEVDASALGLELSKLPMKFTCEIVAGDWNTTFVCCTIYPDGSKTYRNERFDRHSRSVIIRNK